MKLHLKVNGKKRKLDAPPMKRLLDVLREDFGLTGTKEGCGEGECGACTVLLDGEAVNACLVPVAHADGRHVRTVESDDRRLRKLQRAFLARGAAQCGICTPGMLMAACALDATPSRAEIAVGLAGNLCRCTGYIKIFDAVEEALAK
jgi:carbon-monoxide dehydrogenase small subunit